MEWMNHESIEHGRRGTHFPLMFVGAAQLAIGRYKKSFFWEHLQWKADCSLVNFCVLRTMLVREPDIAAWNPKQASFVLTYYDSMIHGKWPRDITTSVKVAPGLMTLWIDVHRFFCRISYACRETFPKATIKQPIIADHNLNPLGQLFHERTTG